MPRAAQAGDIGAWLAGLGLSQYQSAFEANAIDVAVLADLTDEDLERLSLRPASAMVSIDSWEERHEAAQLRP